MTFAQTHIGRGGGDRPNPHHHRQIGDSTDSSVFDVWQFLKGFKDVGDNCISIGKEIASTIISSLRSVKAGYIVAPTMNCNCYYTLLGPVAKIYTTVVRSLQYY